MAPKCTVVTMFFDLTRLNDSNDKTRNMDFYLNNGIPTLRIDNPMIIFCDSVTREKIAPLRTANSSARTIYVEKALEDYDFYKMNYSIIEENRKTDKIYEGEVRTTTSLYLAYMFKIQALKIAKQLDDTEYFIWVDFGCSHILRGEVTNHIRKIIEYPKPKVTMLYIHYRSSESLKDEKKIYEECICGIAANIFSVEATYVNKLFASMLSVFYEHLGKGLGHTDELIFTYCYDRYPELFNIYFGDYYSSASNYHFIVKNYYAVKYYFIDEALAARRDDLAVRAAICVKESVDNGLLSIDAGEIDYINNILSLIQKQIIS